MKDFLKSVARKFGMDIQRYVPMRERPFDVISLIIEHRLLTERAFCFLQIGAFDGLSGDPIHGMIIKHNLNGVFVEPNPQAYQKLVRTYEGRSGFGFENCAVAWEDGVATLYRFKLGAPLPEWTQQVSSFNVHHLLAQTRSLRKAHQFVEPVLVPTMSIKSLRKKHGLAAIDLLQVDTEGFDFEVIKMTLTAGLRPQVINYEHAHLSRAHQHECRELLAAKGYRYISLGKDTLATRE